MLESTHAHPFSCFAFPDSEDGKNFLENNGWITSGFGLLDPSEFESGPVGRAFGDA